MRRWPGRITAFQETPVGIEPTELTNAASVPAAGRLAIWLQPRIIQCPARSRAWFDSQVACKIPPHSEDVQ